jgi:hypothetical protein
MVKHALSGMQRYKKENKTILFIKLILLLFLYHEAKNRLLKQKQVKNDKTKRSPIFSYRRPFALVLP